MSAEADREATRKLEVARALHAEATRGLEIQRAAVDGARARAATVMAAAALVATFLGARAFDVVPTWVSVVGVIALVGTGVSVAVTLWPWSFSWTTETKGLVQDYLDVPNPGDKHAVHCVYRSMAVSAQKLREKNKSPVGRVQRGLQVATGLLGVQVAWWLGALLAVGAPSPSCKDIIVGRDISIARVCDKAGPERSVAPGEVRRAAPTPTPPRTSPGPSPKR